jgi:hypothetical protein
VATRAFLIFCIGRHFVDDNKYVVPAAPDGTLGLSRPGQGATEGDRNERRFAAEARE